MNGFREKIKDFGRRLFAIIVTEEVEGHGRVLIMPQREKEVKAWNKRTNNENN